MMKLLFFQCQRRLTPHLRSLAFAISFALLLLASPAWAEATRVRILAVADTDAHGAANFGLGLDGDNVKRAFAELFAKAGKNTRYTLDLYKGAKASPQHILDYYYNLNSSPTETLVFYYTGHGVTDKDQGHMITTHRGYIPRTVLLQAMRKYNPQLIVLLTDCCANYRGDEPHFPGLKAGFIGNTAAFGNSSSGRTLKKISGTFAAGIDDPNRPIRPSLPEEIPDRTRPKLVPPQFMPPQFVAPESVDDPLSHLFFQHKGLVDINGAELGKSASANVNLGGSYFTLALCKALRKPLGHIDLNQNQFAEWPEFFSWLDTYTIQEAQRGNFYQRPQAFALPTQTN